MKKTFITIILLFEIVNVNAQKSNYDLLQGKWQSTEDKTNFIVFEKNHRMEIASGMEKWDNDIFSLTNSCAEKTNEVSNEKGKFIKVLNENGSLCWYIEKLTSTKLTLLYTGRGNTLAYKRVIVKKKK